jgi:nitronate monooxygenase
MGAAGVSVGTIFIATDESPVSDAYKQALLDYGANDIVLSSKLSGSPLTVINTPYVQSIGTKANWIEWLMQRNKKLKKYLKMLVFARGMKKIQQAAFSATYQTVWVSGPSIDYVQEIKPVADVVATLTISAD